MTLVHGKILHRAAWRQLAVHAAAAAVRFGRNLDVLAAAAEVKPIERACVGEPFDDRSLRRWVNASRINSAGASTTLVSGVLVSSSTAESSFGVEESRFTVPVSVSSSGNFPPKRVCKTATRKTCEDEERGAQEKGSKRHDLP